ncbi:MAG: Fic family protein [Flavobacteriales bacterium]|nr:Fic family protein [Flavobacteriales bacterium]
MRTYDETHTWLRFRSELRQAPPSFWLLVGEVVALYRQLRNAPVPRNEARALERSVVIEGLAARLALDGHALTTDHVRSHLEGHRIDPNEEPLVHEVDDLFLLGQTLQAEDPTTLAALSPELLLTLHRAIAEHADPIHMAGRWRTSDPGQRDQGVPCTLIATFMDDLCDWLNGSELLAPAGDEELHHALLKGLLLELHVAWIVPFESANARLAGVAMQRLLLAAGGDDLLAHLLATHFHRTRPEYLRQVKHGAQGQGDPIPFMAYGLRGLRNALDQLLDRMRVAQLSGLWRDHVRSALDGVPGAQAERQALLLIRLGELSEPVSPSAIPSSSPELAKAYAEVSAKTLQRDLEALAATGILWRNTSGVQVRKAPILAFKGRSH